MHPAPTPAASTIVPLRGFSLRTTATAGGSPGFYGRRQHVEDRHETARAIH
jgi:hypothetical protein